MLHFLRKIRRSLIDSGHMRKYAFYAIGEIALVVIGILIALQINNWNESRIMRKDELNVLKNLKTDLEDNLDEIKGIYQKVSRRKDNVDSIRTYFIEENQHLTLDQCHSNSAGFCFTE